MGKWSKIQKKLIKRAIYGQKSDIHRENISAGRIHGTIYYKNKDVHRGILLVPGIASNRFGMGVLADRLAECSFFCLSIDLPSHYLNVSKFTLGEMSETVTEGVSILRNRYGMKWIAVISHSFGGVGALFSNAGYTKEIEKHIYDTWNLMIDYVRHIAWLEKKGKREKVVFITQTIDTLYARMKEWIFYSLKKGMQENLNVACYVYLAPPQSAKNAIPGLSLLRKLSHKWKKIIVETLLHKPTLAHGKNEHDEIGFLKSAEDERKYVRWMFFRTDESAEFLEYMLSMKEPSDFLTLVENMAKFRHKDGMTNFFEYYQKKYLLAKPKLFIYGSRDLFLW